MKSYSGLSAQAKQQMRATLQKQQAKPSEEKHDERKFDIENCDWIDSEKTKDNEYHVYCEEGLSYEEVVLKFYNETYSDTLQRINDNYVKDRHPEKQKTMEQYLEMHRPEASIMQIGNCLDNVDADKLMECVEDYFSWEEEWNQAHGRPFESLTVALHVDEATSHIHSLKAWRGKDKHGNIIPNREKALEQAGVELPHPDKKVSRYNNRNVTFTAMCREKWLDICEEHGFDIIREPIKDVKAKNKGDYIREREKDFKERSEALETAQKAFIEAEIEQNQKDYAIESISFVLDERENALNQWTKAISKEKEKFEAHVERGNEILANRENELNKREASISLNAENVLKREQKVLSKLMMGNGTVLDYVQKKEQDYEMALRCKYGIGLDESLAPKAKEQSHGYDFEP